jgi:hypothetical protein
VFRSTDAGASWTALTGGMTNLSVGALAIDPAIGTTLYAATVGSDDCRGPAARLFELATCASARCTIDAGLTSAACLGQRIPAGVRGWFHRGAALVDRSNGRSRRRLVRAAKVLRRAAATIARAPHHKKRQITAGCAATLAAAAHEVMATLP